MRCFQPAFKLQPWQLSRRTTGPRRKARPESMTSGRVHAVAAVVHPELIYSTPECMAGCTCMQVEWEDTEEPVILCKPSDGKGQPSD